MAAIPANPRRITPPRVKDGGKFLEFSETVLIVDKNGIHNTGHYDYGTLLWRFDTKQTPHPEADENDFVWFSLKSFKYQKLR